MIKLFAGGAYLTLGIGALLFVSSFSHRVSDLGPHGNTIMAVTASALVLLCAAAFINFVAWYGDRQPKIRGDLNPGMDAQTLRLGVKAGVYGLRPGASYRVIREIRDCYGTVFPVGMGLTFVQRHYLPYHGGHTMVFRPQPMYLQDEDNADVLDHLDAYLVAAGTVHEGGQPGY